MKIIKRFFLFILFNVLLLVMAASFLFFMLLDGRDPTLDSVRYSNVTAKEVISREVTNALESPDGESFSLVLSETAFNELGFKTLNDKGYSSVRVRGFRAWYQGNGKLRVDIPVKGFGFKSVLSATCQVQSNEEQVTLKITRAKIGKLKIGLKLLKKGLRFIQDKFGLDTTLTEGVELDLKNMAVTVKYSALKDVLSMASSGGQNDFLPLLMDMCLDNNVLSVIAGDDFGIKLNFHNFVYNSARDGVYSYVDLESAKTKTQNQRPKLNSDNVNALFSYYTFGYDSLSDGDKEIIGNLGLSSSEQGVKGTQEVNTHDILVDQASAMGPDILGGHVTFHFSEVNFNKILYNQTFAGRGYAFTDNTKVAYIAVDGFYADLKENQLNLYLIISLNGVKICVNTEYTCDSAPFVSGGIRMVLEAVSFGEVELSSDLTNGIKNYIYEFCKDLDDDWITPYEDGSIIINIEQAVTQSGALTGHSVISSESRCQNNEFTITYHLQN